MSGRSSLVFLVFALLYAACCARTVQGGDAGEFMTLSALGGVAHRAVCRALELKRAEFGHNTTQQITPRLRLISAFHPSRLNVNTGRITQPMLRAVFASAGDYLSV